MAKTTVEQFAERVRGALGNRLVSVMLFGSAARRGLAGPADTLVICDRVDAGILAALAEASRGWTRDGHPAPLVFGEAEWKDSADVFAIELGDIRSHHQILAGRDPWAGLTVRDEDVRRQLEHELRGKVTRLRQAFIGAARHPAELGRALTGSVSGFLTMLRAVLRLAGRDAPSDRTALIAAAGPLVGFDAGPVTTIAVAARDGRALKLAPGDPDAAAYLAAVTRTAQYVNDLPTRSDGR